MFDCQKCGACCHSEVALQAGDYVPKDYIAGGCMKRVPGCDDRCIALRGKTGGAVACAIYSNRPTICRQVQAGDPFCLAARARFGLPGGSISPEVMAAILARLSRVH